MGSGCMESGVLQLQVVGIYTWQGMAYTRTSYSNGWLLPWAFLLVSAASPIHLSILPLQHHEQQLNRPANECMCTLGNAPRSQQRGPRGNEAVLPLRASAPPNVPVQVRITPHCGFCLSLFFNYYHCAAALYNKKRVYRFN